MNGVSEYSAVVLVFRSPNEVVNGKNLIKEFQSPVFKSDDKPAKEHAAKRAWVLARKQGFTGKELVRVLTVNVPIPRI